MRRQESPIEFFWNWATERKNEPYLRLLYEAQIVAIQDPHEYGEYLRNASKQWQASALQAMAGSYRTEPLTTLAIAVFDGLFLEYMSTGDHARLTRALKAFIEMAKEAHGAKAR
jgi:hypothetical protein